MSAGDPGEHYREQPALAAERAGVAPRYHTRRRAFGQAWREWRDRDVPRAVHVLGMVAAFGLGLWLGG